MRSRKAVHNITAEVILQVVTFSVGLILPKLIIEAYGSSVNGLRASISQFINYLYIIEMGLGGALIFSLYKPIAEDHKGNINRILSSAKKFYKIIGYYFSSLVLVMILIYPVFVYSEDIGRFDIMILILAIGSAGILDYFTTAKYKVFLVASQMNYIVSITRVIYLIINTVIILILINYELRLSLIYLITLLANVIQVLIIKFYTKRKHPYINFNAEPDLSATSKRNDVILHQISGMVVFGSPILLLTLFSTLDEVSIYSIYALIFTGINMVIGVFNNGLVAGFGQIIAQKDLGSLRKVYSQYEMLYYMLITFSYSCILLLGIPFLEMYTANITDADYIDPTILYLFVVIGILSNLKIPQSTLIIAAGHFKETRNRAIIEALLTLVFSTIFVIFLGLKGVLVGSIVGLLYRSIDLWYSTKITKLSFYYTLIRILKIIITSFVAIVSYVLLIHLHFNGTFFVWIKNATIVSLWVGAVVISTNYLTERKVFNSLIMRFWNVIK